MKVHEAIKSDLVQKQGEDKRTARSDGGFNRVLEEELSRGEGANKSEKEGLENTALSSLAHVPLLDALGKMSGLTNGMGKEVRDVADSMSVVEQMLLSGPVSTQQLGEAIGTLSSEAEKLGDITKSLPADHPLKQIAGELSVLAHVETMKWERGDYV